MVQTTSVGSTEGHFEVPLSAVVYKNGPQAISKPHNALISCSGHRSGKPRFRWAVEI